MSSTLPGEPLQDVVCPPTPPHLPTYLIKLPPEHIERLVRFALPTVSRVVSSTQLPSDSSFNNRIYFLSLELNTKAKNSSNHQTPHLQEAALKVIGRFFGPGKVENEVGCLLLLERFCPDVPVPRVLAWSGDGKTVYRVHRDTTTPEGPIKVSSSTTTGTDLEHDTPGEKATTDAEIERQLLNSRGWMILTRLPGRVLRETDVSSPAGDDLMRQLGKHMATIRTKLCRASGLLPAIDRLGNLELRVLPRGSGAPILNGEGEGGSLYQIDMIDAASASGGISEEGAAAAAAEQQPIPSILSISISPKLLLTHYLPDLTKSPPPISTSLIYNTTVLRDQLVKLSTEPIFASPHRDATVKLVEEFIADTMPRLEMYRPATATSTSSSSAGELQSSVGEENIVFAHTDFWLSNILVVEDSPVPSPDPSASASLPGSTPPPPSRLSVSGIVDFEFAGFFGPILEYVDTFLINADSWPAPARDVFLAELRARGVVDIPDMSGREFAHDATLLRRLTDDVAPWRLREGGTRGPELQTMLKESAERVAERVEELRLRVAGREAKGGHLIS